MDSASLLFKVRFRCCCTCFDYFLALPVVDNYRSEVQGTVKDNIVAFQIVVEVPATVYKHQSFAHFLKYAHTIAGISNYACVILQN